MSDEKQIDTDEKQIDDDNNGNNNNKKKIDTDEKHIDEDEKHIDDDDDDDKKKKDHKVAKAVLIGAAVVLGGAAVIATGGAAVIAFGGAAAATGAATVGGAAVTVGVSHQAAKNPDGKITKAAESIPILGYVASATHAAKGDKDRAKRAAAKCTGSTVTAAVAVGTGAVIVASGGTAAVIAVAGGAAVGIGAPATVGGVSTGAVALVAATASAGAAGGGASVFAESKIAKGIKDESIKSQCKQGTLGDYAKGIGGGAIKGAMAGGAMDAISNLDIVGDVIDAAPDDVVEVGKKALAAKKAVGDAAEKAATDAATDVIGKDAVEIGKKAGKVYSDGFKDDVNNLKDAVIEEHKEKKMKKEDDEEKDNRDYWEYDPSQTDNIYICTGEGMKYICCDKKGRINCDKKGKKGTMFESIPHETDESLVALKSNGYYLSVDYYNRKNTVTTSKDIYYFKVLSHSNSKCSFVSQNGFENKSYYLYFTKGGKKIATKLKKDIKLSEIKFFVSNASK